MLLEFLSFILTLSSAISCPATVYRQCRCTNYEYSSGPRATCYSIETVSELTIAVEGFKGESVLEFEFKRSVLSYIPHDAFHGIEVEIIAFTDCYVASLSDTNVAFEGLESSLGSINFFRNSFRDTWDMSMLKNLRVLETVRFTHGDLRSIANSDGESPSHLDKLKIVDFMNNEISHIGDYAFANLASLNEVTLWNNKIREVKRNMFPNPAPSLTYLDLSKNELTDLPDDLFTNMPKLSVIELQYNKLLILKETTFAPIWDHVKTIETEGIELECDCRMKWMLEKPLYGNFSVICEAPAKLRGKDIFRDVAPEDLRC